MSHSPSLPHRTVPRALGGWGRRTDYLLAGCLCATGVVSLAGLFPTSVAASMGFAIGFTASAVWRALRDPWRAALQGVAVLAWLARVRVYGLRTAAQVDADAVRAVGVGFLLGGVVLALWFAGVRPGSRADR